MMRPCSIILLIALATFSACTPSASVSTSKHTSTLNLFGGRYIIQIEKYGPGNISSSFKSESSGDEIVVEHAEIEWERPGKSPGKIVIEKGRLTVNGEDRGEVKKGSTILVDLNDNVTVTPAEAAASP